MNTNDLLLKRQKAARQYVQADGIFLLQIRHVMSFSEELVVKDTTYRINPDRDYRYVPIDDPDGDYLTNDDLADLFDESQVCVFWETESVWLTPDEARAWATDHAYRFQGHAGREGRENHEWRIYAVSAKGDLAKILQPIKETP